MSIDPRHLVLKHHNFSFEGHNATRESWLFNLTTLTPDKSTGDQSLIENTDLNKTQEQVTQVLVQSTTEFAQNLHDIATRLQTDSINLFTQPEVTIIRSDVQSDSADIGTAEKVVIGAAIIVGCLAVIAILLRTLGPYLRVRKAEKEKDEENILKSSTDLVVSKLGFTNLGCETVSQSTEAGNTSGSQDCSQSSGSTPVTDWSDLSKSSSEIPSSSSADSEENMSGKHTNRSMLKEPPQKKHSVNSLAAYIGVERVSSSGSSKGSPSLHRKPNDEQISVNSTQSLEPLRLEHHYRNRWDDQFDPCGSLPRGNLSHHSHPSESRSMPSSGSRLSLNSNSTGTTYSQTYPTFPIPSKEFVRQMHMDKERRYPSNTSAVKKEKHVRMSPSSHR